MIKIMSVKFYNHKIFDNRLFDFTIDGNAVNNIILAGENGSGKTKLLEEIYEISNMDFHNYSLIYKNKIVELLIDLTSENYCDLNNENVFIDKAKLIITKNDKGTISQKVEFYSDNTEIKDVKSINGSEKIMSLRLNGLYSNVDINYKPREEVKGITNKTLDNERNAIPKDMAHEIIQLLVDIAAQDSSELDNWVGNNKGKVPPEDIYHIRLKRFTNAFKIIFDDNINYKYIRNNSIPIFDKNGQEIEVSSLSSGEKQIIFRGIYLLQNKNSLKGVPVFIDEPEISMHPKWEDKIFDYYRTIFTEDDIQTSQIMIASHSEHILSEVLNMDDCIVLKIDKDNCKKYYKGSNGIILPTMTIAETKYTIFDMYTTDFHCLLYGYIQENLVKDNKGNILSNLTVTKTDKWLKTKGVTIKKYHKKISATNIKNYDTLPTYIRNCIDHPDDSFSYTKEELKKSIEDMIKIIDSYKNSI